MTERCQTMFYVRNLEASLKFYREAVGLEISGKRLDGRATVLTGGRMNHEMLLIEIGYATGPQADKRIGLYHIDWKIGDNPGDLKQARNRLLEQGYAIEIEPGHTASKSIHLRDPDGNDVELFVKY